MRRLGLETPDSVPADDQTSGADDAMLATLVDNARCTFAELTERGYVEAGHDVQARWVDAHIERVGGWRLAPAPLVEQLTTLSGTHLAAAGQPVSLNLTPRRQRRHLNAQYLFLGDVFDVLLHPTDAANAGVKDGQPVTVRTARGEVVGTARVDARMRSGVVSVPHGHEHANVNLLTSIREVDPLTGMARYSGIPVSVHPVPVASF
jgi:anaerobic selenocysteine-containing dehydrogenase